MASTISSFHSINLKFARASFLQWTAHLILILASVSCQCWQTPRGAANKASISTNDVSNSFCLSSSSFVLSSCLARNSSHSGTSSGVSGLSVFIVAVSTALTFVGGLCFLPVTGIARLRWGTLAGHALVTLEDAGYARGETLVTLGERLLTLVTLEDAGYAQGETLVTLGERLLTLVTLEDAGYAQGETLVSCYARLVRFSGVGVPRGPLCLSSVIEVKYASRGPFYIAGSELLSRVSWCESQLLIGSSQSGQ